MRTRASSPSRVTTSASRPSGQVRLVGKFGLRKITVAIIGVMPPSRSKNQLLRVIGGWHVHPTARVGSSMFLGVDDVWLGANCDVRGFSVFRDLKRIQIGDSAIVGHWNWVSSSPFLNVTYRGDSPDVQPGEFSLGDHAAITSRHYVDCSGGVGIGPFSTMAGVRSTILTHQIDAVTSSHTVMTVRIGAYCLVGSNVKLVPGASVPDRCVVGMGSVVVGCLKKEDVLYAGCPAREVKDVGAGQYFVRQNAQALLPGREDERPKRGSGGTLS